MMNSFELTHSGALNASWAEIFENIYFQLSRNIAQDGDRVNSRNGDTYEYLNYKTIVGNPRARCVGGNNRGINIFFLLAESLWIWTGRKDVAFLNIFNSNMAQFSDDGQSFHAPYGFRIRSWGKSSFEESTVEGIDQLFVALRLLKENSEDRRVVINIWNPNLDLGVKSKDLPCNDQIMFKIRQNKLYLTIQNRSNDLHWGLPTNVFQFSFLGEVMAKILDVELGDQVHNSQSLHCYLNNPLTDKMAATKPMRKLYETVSPTEMDFNWGVWATGGGESSRLEEIDSNFNLIINKLTELSNCSNAQLDNFLNNHRVLSKQIAEFSKYFAFVFDLLSCYVLYSRAEKNDSVRHAVIGDIREAHQKYKICDDYFMLALNFFQSRLKETPTSTNQYDELSAEQNTAIFLGL